jgi:hypothetical protein
MSIRGFWEHPCRRPIPRAKIKKGPAMALSLFRALSAKPIKWSFRKAHPGEEEDDRRGITSLT